MNKYYINSQNRLTSIIKYVISEMNQKVYELSMMNDEYEVQIKTLREKIDNLEKRNNYLAYDNKCLSEEIERRNKGD